jgi:hypothetical protein
MINSIHQSSLGTFLRCGEQFRRRYIEGERIPPGVAAGRGTGVHKANEINLNQKVITGKDLKLVDLKDAARDGFIHAFRNGIFLAKEDVPLKDKILNDNLNDCLKLTELYKKKVAPLIQPIEVERSFLIDAGLDLPLVGRMDIERHAKVDDIKTSGRKWAEGRIKKEIQPVFYSYAHEKETGIRPQFNFHILKITKGGEIGSQIQSMRATDENYLALFARLNMMIHAIKSGSFIPPDPSHWICSPRWCGYHSTCVYVGNGRQSKWV